MEKLCVLKYLLIVVPELWVDVYYEIVSQALQPTLKSFFLLTLCVGVAQLVFKKEDIVPYKAVDLVSLGRGEFRIFPCHQHNVNTIGFLET